ncbi:copper(I)-binding protein [Azospirillum brasilense]|uniref:Copper(I)-binding protein n=2 Tax=Azospirillum brasilense TaxID=192 RepID=A0A560BYS1_AZOBR|nr:copper(I)-binding protein [Azospirillum brasilense]
MAAVLLLILVQVPGQAVAMLSAGLAQSFWAASMCGPDGASDRMPGAPDQPKHDLEHCLGCQLGCAPPAMLSPVDVGVPPPRLSGALGAFPLRTRKLRRSSVFRPNARAPPMTRPALSTRSPMHSLLQDFVIMKKHALLLAALVALTAGPVLAHGFKAGPVDIEHPWARATAPSAPNGSAYMVLSTHGPDSDRLLSASTPVADKAELHTHLMDNGVMKMRQVDAIEVSPGSPTALQPGGLHVMLFGLKQPLAPGKAFPLTLTFEKAGPVTVQVDVQSAGSAAPSHGGAGGPQAGGTQHKH